MSNAQLNVTSALPGRCEPYVLLPGEGPAHLVAGQMVRMVATSAETAGSFGVVVCTSPRDRAPIPLHWHAREHDTWFCTRGRLQVWNGRESRVLYPGDFAYVMPGDIHSYQCRGQHTEFFGVVAPGGWEQFFVDAGEKWEFPIYPPPGSRPIDFPRLGAAMGKHGVNRVDGATFSEPPATAADTTLPGMAASYFLEAGFGRRYLLNDMLATTIIGTAETQDLFTMQVIQGPHGAGLPMRIQGATHEVIHVLEGSLTVSMTGSDYSMPVGATANIPAGTTFATRVAGHSARWISVTSGGEVERLYATFGVTTETAAHPHQPSVPVKVNEQESIRFAD